MSRPAPGVAILWTSIAHAQPGDLIVFDQETIRVACVDMLDRYRVKITGTIERGYAAGTAGSWPYAATLPVELHRG